MKAELALDKLVEGNKRFVEATAGDGEIITSVSCPDKETQKPFAVILGCADSRVPAEIVFNCGVGDLFVVRVAGNTVAPSQIGSIEIGCQYFGAELIVVLGHTGCGAIKVTVDTLLDGTPRESSNIAAIVESVSPAVQGLVDNKMYDDRDHLCKIATHANIKQSVERLSQQSDILRDLIASSKLKIVGAEYSLETGVVQFLD